MSKDGWRVKLYQLDSAGAWLDRGTGSVSCSTAESDSYLILVDEDDGSILLQSKIAFDDRYERQNENIIIWREVSPGGETFDFALSFQEIVGCNAVWTAIMAIQTNYSESRKFEEISSLLLPACVPANLEAIRSKLFGLHYSQKELFAGILMEKDGEYLKTLITLGNSLEESKDKANLAVLVDLWKCIFLLNNSDLIQFLLVDAHFESIAGVMEFDPQLRVKANYKQFLQVEVRLKEVGKVYSETLRTVCAMHFKLKLLKENFLRPVMDESGVAAINCLLLNYAQDICHAIFGDTEHVESILDGIASQIGADNYDLSHRSKCVHFIRELFFLSRVLSIEKRVELYSTFLDRYSEKFYGVIVTVLLGSDYSSSEKFHIAESLACVTVVVPTVLRKVVLQASFPSPPPVLRKGMSVVQTQEIVEKNSSLILFVIIRQLIESSDCGVIEQLGDVMKAILDPERMDRYEKANFLGKFYDHYLQWIFFPFVEPNNPATVVSLGLEVVQSQSALSTSRRIIFDILCCCVQGHSYRMKYYVLRNGVIPKCLRLFESKLKYLWLGPIRFLRSIIALKDEFYFRHIVKYDSLRPFLMLLKHVGRKDGLITSSALELIELIRAENMKSLIKYIAEGFMSCFEDISHVDTFDRLKLKYDQLVCGFSEGGEEEVRDSVTHSFQMQRHSDLEREEAYLLDDSEEVTQGTPGVSSNPLALLAECYGMDDAVEEDGISDDSEVRNLSPGISDYGREYGLISSIPTHLDPHISEYGEGEIHGDHAVLRHIDSSDREPDLPPLRSKFGDEEDTFVFGAKRLPKSGKMVSTQLNDESSLVRFTMKKKSRFG